MPPIEDAASIRPTLPEPHLPLARYRLSFAASDPIVFPPFAGALWRGAFGAALKRMSDGVESAPSSGDIPTQELYRYLFETPPPPHAAKMRKYTNAPHPYVIAAPARFEPTPIQPGETLLLDLTLIGRANQAAEAAIVALARMAGEGLKKPRGRLALTSVESVWHAQAPESRPVWDRAGGFRFPTAENPLVPPAPDRVEIVLLNPLRLVVEGRLVGPHALRPSDFFGALIRRASMLMTFHAGCDLETDFQGLKALARRTRMDAADLSFADQSRWSASSQRGIDMGGLIGRFRLDLAEASALWPYLWLGQWIHAGKGAVMGMGAYQLQRSDS